MATPRTPVHPEQLALAAMDAATLCGLSRSQWWKLHASGRIPLPVRLGTRAPRWRVDELRAWLAAGCPNRETWETLTRGGDQ
jgi:predicted DNA-binding transcriptional regulator AlpA